jgi:hypothetical protein
MYRIQKDDGGIFNDQKLIFKEIEDFYNRTLFSKTSSYDANDNLLLFVENIEATVLSESESNVLESYISYEEASKILYDK